MEGGRFVSSRENPRNQGFPPERGGSSGNSKEIPPEMIQKPPTPLLDRFRALLKEREEEWRTSDDEDDSFQPSMDDIVQIYEVVLSELNFNSKPIITELTMIAGDQKEYAEGIADAICDRIVEVPIEQKLPSLYLLDSVVKNIGFEYIRHFASRLPEIFCEAYRQVPPNQHRALRHLFGTWSTVFQPSVLRKIATELEFSSLVNHQSSASASASSRSSESPSPRPAHGIHVNPKYLEARRQLEQANVVNEVQDVRGISSGIQRYGQKPPFGHDESDIDHSEILFSHAGIRRFGSPGMVAHISNSGAERLISTKAKPLRPSSPLKDGSIRSLSPSDGFRTVNSPRRAVERASPSHFEFEYGPTRETKRDGERNDWWIKHASDNDRQLIETSNVYHLSNGSNQQRPRALIDAYGNYRGERILNKKPIRIERLEVNVRNNEAAARSWQNTEEEEYVWEDMSPTLANHSRSNELMASRPLGTKTGSGRPNTVFSDPNFRMGYQPSQPQLSVVDDSVMISEDGFSHLGSGCGPMSEKSAFGLGTRFEATQIQGSNYSNEPWNLQHHFRHSLQQHNAKATSFPSSGPHLSAGQRTPSLMDNIEALSSVAPATMVDKQLGQRPRSPPMAPHIWPLVNVHKSYPHSLPLLPPQKQMKGHFDLLDTNKSLMNQGPNDSSIFPRQQFDTVERKALNSTALLQLPHQLGGLTSFHNQSQGLVAPLIPQVSKSHVPQENFHPRIPAKFPAHLAAQPFSGGYPLLGPGPVINPFPLIKLTDVPSVPIPNVPNTSYELQGGVLPPLPPGPPPASSQMGPSSQNMGPIGSQPPAGTAFSGLISSLMAQGLISLTAPVTVQDSVGVEFNPDVLKVRHESAIKALYADLPRQCTTCGLRFKCQEEHSTHMDWHVTKNRVSKNRKQKPSRNWFVSSSVWLSSAEAIGNDAAPGFLPTESVMEKKDDEELSVPADENQKTCALCGEEFVDFYNHDTDEWVYRGAVYSDAPNGSTSGTDSSQFGPIVHAKCRSESTVVSPGEFELDERGKTEEDGQRKRMRL